MAYKYDVVIIGGGNGGIMAACRASMMGLKTLVIEKHNMVGGAATSFVRGRFEFEASLHEIPDFGQGELRGNLGRLFDELGIDVEWLQIPDAFRLIVAEGNNITLDARVPHGRKEFLAYMESQAPGCTESIERMFDASAELERGLQYIGMSRGNPDIEVLKRNYPDFCKLLTMSAAEFMRSVNMPQRAIDIISAYWPYQGSCMEEIDASRYVLMSDGYFSGGAFMPKMRSHEIANAIQKRARQFGADFWYETEVTKVITNKKGAICAVETADGRRVETCAVISNVFPEIVYGKMLDNKALVPEFELKKINARTYGFRGFAAYFGLNASAEEIGIKDYNVFINSTTDTKVLYDLACATDPVPEGDADNISCTCLNIVNPEATPEGTCHFAITGAFAADSWANVKPEDYVKTKRALAGKMLDRYEHVMGIDIRSHIEEVAIASPVTFSRYMGTPQGSIYGYHSARWDGMSARTMVLATEPTVPGLFFVGAHGSRLSGFLPTLSSGDQTAKQVMGYVMGGGKR